MKKLQAIVLGKRVTFLYGVEISHKRYLLATRL